MKTKHTKGEWRIERPDFENIHIVIDDGFICSIPSNGLSIHEECREEAEANAKLIAAAPKFYKNAVSECILIESTLRNIHDGIIKNSSALIPMLETLLNTNKETLKKATE